MAGNSRVERVHATSNGGGGIHLCVSSNDPVAEGCILRSSSAFRNGGQYAVRGGTETLVEGNTITYNAGTGIWLEASTALHNAVHFNQGSGILAVAGLLIGNHVGNNSNYGIEFNGTFSGWRDNVLNANGTGAVNGSSTQLGVNVCVGAPCP